MEQLNLYEIRQQLLHRQKQIITKIEIKYLKQMNQLLRDKESAIKKVKCMFKRDIRIIEQVIYTQHTAAASANTANPPQPQTSCNLNHDATSLLTEQHLLQLLQQCASSTSTNSDSPSSNTNTTQRTHHRHPRMTASSPLTSNSLPSPTSLSHASSFADTNPSQLSTMSSNHTSTSNAADPNHPIMFSVNSITARLHSAADEQRVRSQQAAQLQEKEKDELERTTTRDQSMHTVPETSLRGESKNHNHTDIKRETGSNSEEEKKIHKCSECGTFFAKRSALSTHIAAVHKGFLPFQCKQCMKQFATHNELQTHFIHKHSRHSNSNSNNNSN